MIPRFRAVPDVIETESRNLPDNTQICYLSFTVNTGRIESAGTDALPRICLGAYRFDLTRSHRADINSNNNSPMFERGCSDLFEFYDIAGLNLGYIRNHFIELSHNNAKTKPGWYVGKLSIHFRIKTPEGAVLAGQVLYKEWAQVGWISDETTLRVQLQPSEVLSNYLPSNDLTLRSPANTPVNKFTIYIKTSDRSGAGTNANIHLHNFGIRYTLGRDNHNDFERGSIEHYSFNTPGKTLQNLRNSAILLESDGSHEDAAWCVDNIQICINNDVPYKSWILDNFAGGRWLSDQEPPYYCNSILLQQP